VPSRSPPRAASLALASLLLHALGAIAMLALPVRGSGTRPARASVTPTTLEVLVEIAPEAASDLDREATPRARSGAEPDRASQPSSASPARSERVTPVSSSGDAPPQSTQGGAAEAWSFPPGGPPAGDSARHDDGLTPAIRKGVAVTVRDALREAADRDAHRVVPGYGDRELALGLTPGGELVTISEAMARRSLVPDEGHAELRFDADQGGVVYAAEVVDASSAWSEWQRVANDVASSAPTLRMPREAHGLAMVVRVESYRCLPPFCAVPTVLARARMTAVQAF
jgi:hypothetical protein